MKVWVLFYDDLGDENSPPGFVAVYGDKDLAEKASTRAQLAADGIRCSYFVQEHKLITKEEGVMKVSASDIKKLVEPDNDSLGGHDALGDEVSAFGCRATIDLKVPYGADYIVVPVTSPGLWDILVHSEDDPYMDEVFEEEKHVLITLLKSIGLEVTDVGSDASRANPS